MANIYIVSEMSSSSGIGVHCNGLSSSLKKIWASPVKNIDIADRQAVDRYRQNVCNDSSAIHIFIGNLNGINFFKGFKGYKIAYTVWESTKLPDSWQASSLLADEVWVPSYWLAGILHENGIKKEKVFVVPEGVDIDCFNLDIQPHPFLANVSGFKFLSIGKAEPRKSTYELLQAFDAEFQTNESAILVLGCHNHMIPGFDSVKFLESLALRNRHRIVLLQPFPDRATVASIFRACDAFVLPSKAEAWGLPILEAMACGLPTALIHYSGQTEYANSENSYSISYRLTDIEKHMLPHFQRSDDQYGKWATPDFWELRKVLRYMYSHRKEGMQLGISTSSRVASMWNWENSAKVAKSRLLGIVKER